MARLHALLVGINIYKSEKLKNYPLKGCLNDVARVADVLRQRFPDEAEIRELTESEATRASILNAFRSQLIEPARAWANSGRPEPAPAFLFHFSGHGSLARDITGIKPSGFDETIVPYDSRQADIFDLRDWELGAIIDELGQYTHNITIVLDCCHSGSGTRNSGRMCEPDLRVPPAVDRMTLARKPNAGLRSATSERMTDYVVLAACDAKQIAEEYHENSGGDVRVFGAMTYALTDAIRSLSSPAVTYRELHEMIHDKVRSWYPSQSPQCEGDRDRLLFAMARAERDACFSVVTSSGDECTIDAGLVHGFANGDEFDVYASYVRTRATGDDPIARLQIRNAGVVSSQCRVQSGLSPVPVRSLAFPMVAKTKRPSANLFAQHQSVLRIRNSHSSALQGNVVCALLRMKSTDSSNASGSDAYEPLLPDSHDLHRVEAGTAVCFAVTNRSSVAVYCQILSLGYDGSVSRIWPKLTGEQVALEPGRTVRTSRFRLRFAPDDKTTLQAREFVKIFAATVPFDVDMLCTGTRSADSIPAFKEDWTTAELVYEFTRPAIA